jgi:uncharacterized membrane protein
MEKSEELNENAVSKDTAQATRKSDDESSRPSNTESASPLITRQSLYKRGMELVEKTRRIMFTDAAVAIAMTLLILPLMDAAVEAQEKEGISTFEWFQHNKDLLLTFFLSYMIVCMAWMDHDRLFRRVSHFNSTLHVLNFLWLMAIAFIPAATILMNSVAEDPLQHFVWIGTFLFAKCLTFGMTLVVHKDPGTWLDGGPQFPQLVASMVTIVLLVIALLVSMTSAGYWILFIMFTRVPITRFILWKWPSLVTRWQVPVESTKNDGEVDKKESTNSNNENDANDDASSKKKRSSNSNNESGNDYSDTNDDTRARSPEELKHGIAHLLDFKDRIDGLMEAERRIIFTDAAAAIALTLLVLPLMDAATEARDFEITTAEWFEENKQLLLSFFSSYLVIILCWSSQDRLFRHVRAFTRLLSNLNFLWLLAIVFVPVATSIMNLVKDDLLQHVVYIGTVSRNDGDGVLKCILLSCHLLTHICIHSSCVALFQPLLATFWTTCMTIEVHRNPGTWEEDGGPEFPFFLSCIVSLVLTVVALLLSMTAAGYLSLLILVLKTPIVKVLLWKWPGLKTRW